MLRARIFITALVATLPLASCGGLPDLATAGAGGVFFARSAPDKVRVSEKKIVIAGPRGFCIDPAATRDNANSAFVLLGSCAAIANSASRPSPDITAILMASVSAEDAEVPIAQSMSRLAQFFNSASGHAVLSRDGQADTVEVLETREEGGMFFIHARDLSGGALPGAGDEYWRALFDVKGRIVSASVVGLQDRPISGATGLRTIKAFARRIRAENQG